MALEFSLLISTDLEPIQALQIVSKGLGLEWENLNTYLSGPGISVSAISDPDQSDVDAFGFQANVSVQFRIYPNEDYENGERTLLQVTMELLHQVPGDAVLLFNGEDIVLQRIGGQLVLNEEWDNWTTSQLAEVTLPYKLRNLPSPFL